MQRRLKLLVALLVLAGAAAVLLLQTGARTPDPALGVSEAKERADELEGQDVVVRGTVVAGSLQEEGGRVVEFAIQDQAHQLRVVYNRTPPDNFGLKEVVVDGRLFLDSQGVPYLEAASIQVGCASKY